LFKQSHCHVDGYPDTTAATFGYDERSNLTSAANQNIGYTNTYDLSNRLASVLDSNNKTVSYQYNSLNQRTQMIADGRTITYTYDDGNRLYQVLSPNPVATFLYDLAGRRQSLSYPWNEVPDTFENVMSCFN
jgi:YD repeat-containing protein